MNTEGTSAADPAVAATNASPLADPVKTLELKPHVVEALSTVYDPEIPVNIYDLGLVYALDVDDAGAVRIRMTLTAPGCPVAQTFPATVEQAVESVSGVTNARVELVWEPPWSREMMSEPARLQLGMI
jgi:FeS assembly SUF system protein